jgi:hypothetical protein
LTGAASCRGVTSTKAVFCPPSALRARTVIRTGTSAKASGRIRIVTGTFAGAPIVGSAVVCPSSTDHPS